MRARGERRERVPGRRQVNAERRERRSPRRLRRRAKRDAHVRRVVVGGAVGRPPGGDERRELVREPTRQRAVRGDEAPGGPGRRAVRVAVAMIGRLACRRVVRDGVRVVPRERDVRGVEHAQPPSAQREHDVAESRARRQTLPRAQQTAAELRRRRGREQSRELVRVEGREDTGGSLRIVSRHGRRRRFSRAPQREHDRGALVPRELRLQKRARRVRANVEGHARDGGAGGFGDAEDVRRGGGDREVRHSLRVFVARDVSRDALFGIAVRRRRGRLQERAHDGRRGTRQSIRARLVHRVQLSQRTRAERRRGRRRDALVREPQSALFGDGGSGSGFVFVPLPLPQQPLGVVAGQLARGSHHPRRVGEHERPARDKGVFFFFFSRTRLEVSSRRRCRSLSGTVRGPFRLRLFVKLVFVLGERVGGGVGERGGDRDAPLADGLARGVGGQPRGGAREVDRSESVADAERLQQRTRALVAQFFRDEKQVRLEGRRRGERGDVGGRREPGACPHPGRVL